MLKFKKLTVVALHGFTCDNLSAKKFATEVVSTIKLPDLEIDVFAPDMPGHGTEPLGELSSLEDFVKFVKVKIDDNVQTPYVILGFSMGGMIALKYSELYGSDTNLMGIGVWASPILPLEEALTPPFKDWARKILLDVLPDPVFNKAKNTKLVTDFMKKMDVNIQPFERMGLKRIISALSNSTFSYDNSVPKCFVYGVLDPLVTTANFYYLQENKPLNSQMYLFNNAGHFGTRGGRTMVYHTFGAFIKNLVANGSVFTTNLLPK